LRALSLFAERPSWRLWAIVTSASLLLINGCKRCPEGEVFDERTDTCVVSQFEIPCSDPSVTCHARRCENIEHCQGNVGPAIDCRDTPSGRMCVVPLEDGGTDTACIFSGSATTLTRQCDSSTAYTCPGGGPTCKLKRCAGDGTCELAAIVSVCRGGICVVEYGAGESYPLCIDDAGQGYPPRCDGGVGDAGSDAGTMDAGAMDAGMTDAGSTDAGMTDAGSTDAGEVDAGAIDAGPVDAGSIDAGGSVPDAGSDAGTIDAGSPDAGLGIILTFTASPTTGDAGIPVTFTWTTDNADFCSLVWSCTVCEPTGSVLFTVTRSLPRLCWPGTVDQDGQRSGPPARSSVQVPSRLMASPSSKVAPASGPRIVALGGLLGITTTDAEAFTGPPRPEQVRVKVVSPVGMVVMVPPGGPASSAPGMMEHALAFSTVHER